MTLVLDNRTKLQDQAGLHALIVGISAYPDLPTENEALKPQHYGMRQLSSTALTAYRIYRWLLDHEHNLPIPIATCRLLLSPSASELAVEPAMNNLGARCTVPNFVTAANDWRSDAISNRQNLTFFYFAGHGIQRSKRDAVLLLEGFGNGIGGALLNAVDMLNIHNGMASAGTRPNMAQTQFYFVDACRNFPAAFKHFERETTSQVFSVELAGEDRRHAPVFYAAVPGARAQAVRNDQTLFSKALLECLDGGAGELIEIEGQDRWHVTALTLSNALGTKISDLNRVFNIEQDFDADGVASLNTRVLVYLDGPPSVDVVLQVHPPEALQFVRIIALRPDEGIEISGLPAPLSPHPYQCKWLAGVYRVSAMIDPVDPRFRNYGPKTRPILPPQVPLILRVTP